MRYSKFTQTELSVEVMSSCFNGVDGSESMLQFIGTDPTLPFEVQLDGLLSCAREVCGNTVGRAVFRRFFVSDAANQGSRILERLSELDVCGDCATSLVEQPPLNGAKVALWLYLQEGADVTKVRDGLYSVEHNGLKHLWEGMSMTTEGSSHEQMQHLFEDYTAMLKGRGCSLRRNCLRTWLFVQNVDVNYAGVVTGRNDVFAAEGLTPDTNFISSTGIQGRCSDHRVLVQMDSYAIEDIRDDQIQFLHGSTHLNPTHEYGVSFERGTAVHVSDRSYAYISGTASINNRGEVVHVGDIANQTLRMWENVEVLLSEGEFSMDDIAHMIVYLRDLGDYTLVSRMFAERFPSTPMVIVLAPVCRPTWLIEMECIAIRPNQ